MHPTAVQLRWWMTRRVEAEGSSPSREQTPKSLFPDEVINRAGDEKACQPRHRQKVFNEGGRDSWRTQRCSSSR